jgi:hypothetical protein
MPPWGCPQGGTVNMPAAPPPATESRQRQKGVIQASPLRSYLVRGRRYSLESCLMATAFALLRPSALRSLRLLRFSTSARKSKPRHLTPDVKLPARHPTVTRTHPEGTDLPLDADETKPKRSQLALDGLLCPSLTEGHMARIALNRRCRDLAARSSRQELDRPELLRAGRDRPVARDLARALPHG